jgi:hypothetical protein
VIIKLKKISLLLLLLISCSAAMAQTGSVSGTITDSTDKSSLIGVTVGLQSGADAGTWVAGAVTDVEGKFNIPNLKPGEYTLKATYLGYNPIILKINVEAAAKDLGGLKMSQTVKNLQDVVVSGTIIRAEQKGDTTQFNANAYKTNPDATAEDLVTKMPGVTTEGGTVKAQGEEVKRVLIDGKPYFSDDPNVALKNIPAEIIDKVQVFDQASDQAQFTGYDDGNSTKTINIITKQGMNNGQFGRVYAGYGTDNRYLAGGNLNFFKEDRRISVLGLSNNINQQNFSTEDLLGVTSGSSGSSGRGRGGPGGGSYGNRGGGSNNFMVGQAGGIAATNAFGVNYSDTWGKKIKLTGSYFFNMSDRDNNSDLTRQFILTDSALTYEENSVTNSVNSNHRFNLRFEYTIDSMNSLIITPNLSLQQNNSTALTSGRNFLLGGFLESRTDINRGSDYSGFNFSGDVLFRHKFKKQGRTLSLNASSSANSREGEGTLYSLNKYFKENDSTLLDQQWNQDNGGHTVSSNLTYTEPMGKTGQLQFSYNPSYTSSETDKTTLNRSLTGEGYTLLDTTLSNSFDNIYLAHKAGMGYRYNGKKSSLMIGLNYQYASLSGKQVFPLAFTVDKTFSNFLPQAMLNYKFSKDENIRIMYRSSTDAPSISQLQGVIDNSNPLFLSTGNPDLKQAISHRLNTRYGKTNAAKATNRFFMIALTYTKDYIGNSTLIASRDTILNDGTVLFRGSQLSRPVNLEGYLNARTLLSFGLPVKKLKSNMNIFTGFTFNRTPALINEALNIAANYNLSQGISLSSNISKEIDFNISYTANYSLVQNSLQMNANNNYFYQVSAVKFNWMFYKGFVFNTNLNHTMYSGLSQSFNQSYLLWNASLGYKILKDKSLEAKASVFDILKQNNSISRTVTETYIEDNETTVLQRYLMFSLTYNIKHYKKAAASTAPAPAQESAPKPESK